MENDLKIRLEQHAMWLLDKTKGQRFVAKKHENLRYANLHSASLHSADLRYANLHSANLRYADGFKFVPLQVVNTNIWDENEFKLNKKNYYRDDSIL